MHRTGAIIESSDHDAGDAIAGDRDRRRWTMAATAIGLSSTEAPVFVELCSAGDATRLQDYLFMRLVDLDHQIQQFERRRDALLYLMHSLPATGDVARNAIHAELGGGVSGRE